MKDATVCYVFSDLESPDHPYLVGRLRHEPRSAGEFQYARSFIESTFAHALDPLHLPLQSERFTASAHPFIQGVFLDAGPDDWGRRSLLYRGKLSDGLGPLLYGSGSGVGALLFSGSRDAVKPRPTAPRLRDIPDLLSAAMKIEKGGAAPVPAHIAKLLDAGTSMGGARPKAVVEDNGRLYLAKFPSSADVLDQPAIESATLTLAAKARICVPNHRLVSIAGRNVLLVERFDVEPIPKGFARRHYLSMASLLLMGRAQREASYRTTASYMGLASVLAAHGGPTGDQRQELFRRMSFNVLIGNVDDHARNHGFLMKCVGGPLELAPMFDVAPSNGTAASVAALKDHQAIGIGALAGAERSLDNLLSSWRDFGFEAEAQARSELQEVAGVVCQWDDVFVAAGVSARDRDLVRHRIGALAGFAMPTPRRAQVLKSFGPTLEPG